jgi:hypothetical protein
VVTHDGLPPTSFLSSVPFMNVSPKDLRIYEHERGLQRNASNVAFAFWVDCITMGCESILILVDTNSYLWGQTKNYDNHAGMVRFTRHDRFLGRPQTHKQKRLRHVYVRWSPSTAIDYELKTFANEIEEACPPPWKKRRLG